MRNIKELLMDAPIIAAVKDDAGLRRALESDCKVIFLLYGTIVNIDALVRDVQGRGKLIRQV